MSVPITSASDLNSRDILLETYKVYINGNQLRWLMGRTTDSVIYMKEDFSKGRGDTTTFSLSNAFKPVGVRRGSQMIEGSENNIELLTDQVTVDYVNYAGILEQVDLVNVRTPLEIVGLLKPQIIDAHTQILRNEILDSAGAGLLTVIDNADGTSTTTPVAGAASPNRTRVLFGADDANYNAAFAAGMLTVDAAADKLSVSMLRNARFKALDVTEFSGGVKSRKMRPFRIVDDNNAIQEKYVLLVDAIGAAQIRQDVEFKDLRDLDRENSVALPFFNGSKFLGEVEGAMIYLVEELNRIQGTGMGAAGKNVSHALYCGAQAFGVSIAKAAEFQERKIDYGTHLGVNLQTIRGTKMLKFGGVESSVLHIFHYGELV